MHTERAEVTESVLRRAIADAFAPLPAADPASPGSGDHRRWKAESTRRHDRNVELESELARLQEQNLQPWVELEEVRLRKRKAEQVQDALLGRRSVRWSVAAADAIRRATANA
jgi:hypothetical protein